MRRLQALLEYFFYFLMKESLFMWAASWAICMTALFDVTEILQTGWEFTPTLSGYQGHLKWAGSSVLVLLLFLLKQG